MKYLCIPCLINQAIKMSELVGLNENQIESTIYETMKILKNRKLLPIQVSASIQLFIKKEFFNNSATFDPYKEIKYKANDIVKSNMNYLNGLLDEAEDRLMMAIKIAAAGNIIDFGASLRGNIDVEKEIRDIPNLSFEIFHYSKFTTRLKNAKKILYITDNSGEIFCDKLLIIELKKLYPILQIIVAVRDIPVLNDATLNDANYANLGKYATVISSGSKYPGTYLKETSEEFKQHYENADIIISKGQGNYESLCFMKKENLFFILRVKCQEVAKNIGVPIGKLVLV